MALNCTPKLIQSQDLHGMSRVVILISNWSALQELMCIKISFIGEEVHSVVAKINLVWKGYFRMR